MQSTTTEPSNAVRNVCRQGKITETVVLTVSEAVGVDPLEMEPMYEVVDPDALNRLIQAPGIPASPNTTIRFSMAGCDVVVYSDGEVIARPTATEEAQSTPPQVAD
ncbi:HalOD1 output domain-containing protein [Halomarina rubra]|uniref:HalOD1 output domain-containing protein n=1 Tax=Halomarina rubra TaxID=2071873 RepID=A0ABD6AWV6_9EURY|nr:HalOD1 output domain-containing protein [Halomarina rubra]